MMKLPTLLIALPLLVVGCDGGDSEEDTAAAEACAAPIAEAGDDLLIRLGDSVTLDGSQSDWCSTTSNTVNFTWAFLQAPPGSAIDETSLSDNRTNSAVSPVFTPDVQGDYVLGLTITDINGDSAQDLVVVTVGAGNATPVADCGGNYSGAIGEAVQIDGSDSYDPENRPISYEWSLNTPECSSLDQEALSNASTDAIAFVPDCGGQYEVSLVVADDESFSDPVVCVVDVEDVNVRPLADAGERLEIGACGENPLQLNGYASYDVNGDDLSYAWAIVDAPEGSAVDNDDFSDQTLPNPTFEWDVEGEYTVQLQVFDGELTSAPDTMSFVVGDISDNVRPVANAGQNVDVAVEVSCTFSGAWVCPPCPQSVVNIDASASFDEDGDPLDIEWSTTALGVDVDNNNSAVTQVIIPEQAARYLSTSSLNIRMDLQVQDCLEESLDSMNIFYTCRGN